MTTLVTRPEREAGPCLPSPEVAREARYRAAQDAIGVFVDAYREWAEGRGGNAHDWPGSTGIGAQSHMDPMEQRDAAYECGCGQCTLPSDRKRTCNCFGNQNAPPNLKLPFVLQTARGGLLVTQPTPDLMTILAPTPKEPAVPEPTPAPVITAKYGFKADGVTPRKRPAPAPASLEKARAARRAKAEAKAAIEGTASPFILKVVADFDAEITRLTAARDALLEAVSA